MTAAIPTHRLTQNQMATALDCAGESIVITDKAGIVQYVNPSFCLLSAYPREEVIGQKPSLWRSDRHETLFYEAIWTCILAGQIWKGEVTNRKKDGSLFDALLTIAPIYNDQDELDGFVSTLSDVTAYKKLQQDLQESWYESKRESNAKTKNLAYISHDIRTPLNGILGIMEILGECEQNQENLEYIATMKRAGQKILALVNNILDYSKIDAEKLELETIEFDILDSIKDVHHLLSPKAKAVHSVIKLQIPSRLPQVMGDPNRFSRILQNLVSNAVKFTENGEILISLQTEAESEAEIRLKLQIRDSGIGIAKEVQERLFEQYTQANSSISRKYGGTGLGLAICKKLVELMGGEVSLESQLGAGTTFTVIIPFHKAAVTDAATSQPRAESTLAFNGLSALVCEDDELSQKIMQRLLEKLGLKVELAANGQEGLSLLQTKAFDVAFVDFQMPLLSGLELARKIREQTVEKFAQTPLIAVTGSVQFFKEVPLEQTDFNDFIVKPYTMQTIIHSLNKVLGS